MGDLVTITTTGRATADVELKTSTNGKNTMNITVRRSRQSGVARATCPD